MDRTVTFELEKETKNTYRFEEVAMSPFSEGVQATLFTHSGGARMHPTPSMSSRKGLRCVR